MIYKYYFRGSLETHTQFYKNFILNLDLPEKDISCSLKPREYIRHLLSKNDSKIKIYINFLGINFFYFFLFKDLVKHKNVILHLKKVNVKSFAFLKHFFQNKLVIIFEGEGDPSLERAYIERYDHKNISLINEYNKQESILRQNISLSDFLLYGNQLMVDNIKSRYKSKRNLKMLIRPMTYSQDDINIQPINIDLKKSLGFKSDDIILLYSGNLLYRWQCFQETIDLAKKIIAKIPSAKFLVLTRSNDLTYALKLLRSSGINDENFCVRNVDFSLMNSYLSIASFGFALRHCDEMNRCTPAAKIIEYAAAGVVPITSMSMGEYGRELYDLGIESVINDVENISSDTLSKLISMIKNDISPLTKEILSNWAIQYSYEETEKSYLRQLMNENLI